MSGCKEEANKLAWEFAQQFSAVPGDDLIKLIEDMMDTGLLKSDATPNDYMEAVEEIEELEPGAVRKELEADF